MRKDKNTPAAPEAEETHAVYSILAEGSAAPVTYARFFVPADREQMPGLYEVPFMRAIRAKVLRPLDPSEPDPERSGWCRRGEPFDLELEPDHVFHDGFIVLGMRTDRWAIPAQLLRAKLREAVDAALAGTGRERLSRKEKTELKELVVRKLRRQMAPTTRVVDLTWSIEERLVRFSSHSPKAASTMVELFEKTFGIPLTPESPYTLAARLGLGLESALPALEPSGFETADLADLEVSL